MKHISIMFVLGLALTACGGPASLAGSCDSSQDNACMDELVCDESDDTEKA